MIERVSMEQRTFRVPGLWRDRRGVLLGKHCLFSFDSIDRLVRFLAACGDHGALGELLGSLQLRRLQNESRAHEVCVQAQCPNAQQLDALSSLARLVGGRTWIGARKHYVPFRDAAAPAGYDAIQLQQGDEDLVLYDSTGESRYRWGRALSLTALIDRLELRPNPAGTAASVDTTVLLLPPPQLHAVVARYLLDRGIAAEVASIQVEASSLLDDGPSTHSLFRLTNAPPWLCALFAGLPGMRVFESAGQRTFVTLGFTHPLPLAACEQVLEPGWFLFEAPSAAQRHGRSIHIPTGPAFCGVHTTIEIKQKNEPTLSTAAVSPQVASPSLQIPLRAALRPNRRPTVAAKVPVEQRVWLAQLLYKMPTRLLEGFEVALSEPWIFLRRHEGLESMVLGHAYTEHVSGLYVLAGCTLAPALKETELHAALPALQSSVAFVGPRDELTLVARDAFGLLSRKALPEIEGALISASRPSYDTNPLAFVTYDE